MRHDYVLTEKGGDLAVVLLAMQSWGDRWVFGKDAAPVVLRHDVCGHDTELVAACAVCGERLRPGEVTPLPGPGLDAAEGSPYPETRAALARLAAPARNS